MASSSSSKGKGKDFESVPEHHHAIGDEIPWPVVRAEDIEDEMEHRVHFLDDSKGRTQACLSEMGVSFLAVLANSSRYRDGNGYPQGRAGAQHRVDRASLARRRERVALHSRGAGDADPRAAAR